MTWLGLAATDWIRLAGQKHVAWYVFAASMCGLSVSTLTAVFANDGKNPAARLARCFIGFGVAMVWIMAIADEVVQVLQVGHAPQCSVMQCMLTPCRRLAIFSGSRTQLLA